jgi:hypothetical protein
MARRLLLLLLVIGMLPAATRDFLTAEEIDQVRAAQDPNIRVQLYLKFAQQRVAQMNQLLSRERAGRTALVHDLLEDYTGIIEAMDTVTDDALRRKVDITKGIALVTPGEREMLAQLMKVEAAGPSDMARYEFVLKDAMDATKDSIDLFADLGGRALEVSAKDQKEEEARKAGLTSEDAKRETDDKAKQQKQEQTRKPPTLRRPGDPPPKGK